MAALMTNQTQLNSEERYSKTKKPGKVPVQYLEEIMRGLEEQYTDTGIDLKYNSPFNLLIAAILSTQSTEQEVNALMPSLLAKYPTIESLADAPRAQLEFSLKMIGFYRQKAKYLQETSRILLEKHEGQVPDNLTELTQLPGVARKIASLYLAEIHQKAEGIVVDTHVHRVANRLGLSAGKSATKVEQDLMKVVPNAYWITLPKLFIAHGRKLCHIQRPACRHCPLNEICPSAVG